MKTKTTGRGGWRIFIWALVLAGPPMHGVEISPPSDYEKAVQVYVEAAATQMRVIRTAVDVGGAKISGPARKVWSEIYPHLDRCDELVEQLRTATPQSFDPLKAKFERTRAGMIEAWARARAAAGP